MKKKKEMPGWFGTLFAVYNLTETETMNEVKRVVGSPEWPMVSGKREGTEKVKLFLNGS